MRLIKSDIEMYRHCEKSFWLSKHKPELFAGFAQEEPNPLQIEGGFAVEAAAQALFNTRDDAHRYRYQQIFETSDGLHTRTDIVRNNADGTVDLLEVKSAKRANQSHVDDVAFQLLVAQKSGLQVRRAFVVHVNPDYVHRDPLNHAALITQTDVTDAAMGRLDALEHDIAAARTLLAKTEIDEESCSCLYLSRGNHCASFAHFNPDIPTPSIYDLPGINTNQLTPFVDNGQFSLAGIAPDAVTPSKRLVLQSAQKGRPIVDPGALAAFYAGLTYPLYFIDYEAFGAAIPIVDGIGPHQQIPFQFSLHILDGPDDSEPRHVEYLSPTAQPPLEMIEHMRRHIGATGNLMSWHASYENGRNSDMAGMYPQHADFLQDLTARTIDLERQFKTTYVDIRFQGSTSIKKVLPVLVPDVSYDALAVTNGTAAMAAWRAFIDMPAGVARDARQAELLAYCALDTFAMVSIFRELLKVQRHSEQSRLGTAKS